jgi:hypothetical protein
MSTVSSVSRRKVFNNKNSTVSDWEDKLAKKEEELFHARHKCAIYAHMRQRIRDELVGATKRNMDMKQYVKTLQLKASDLKRAEVAANGVYGNAERELHKLQESVCTELQYWENELQQRQTVVKEKTHFENFYRKQMSKDKSPSPSKPLTRKQTLVKRKGTAKNMFGEGIAGMQTHAENEERRFEEAFRAIGIRLDDFSPNQVINSCLYLESMHKDLDTKLEEEHENLNNLKATEDQLQKALRDTMFTSERTTNRSISIQEDKLAALSKLVGKEKSQYIYILDVIRPVKIGLQNLVKRVLNVTIDPEDIDVIEKSMHLVVQKVPLYFLPSFLPSFCRLPSFTFFPFFLHLLSFLRLPSFLHLPSFAFLPSPSFLRLPFLHLLSFTCLPSFTFIPSFLPSFLPSFKS